MPTCRHKNFEGGKKTCKNWIERGMRNWHVACTGYSFRLLIGRTEDVEEAQDAQPLR
jgi:hypothetical protein